MMTAMAGARARKQFCTYCGKHRSEVGELSSRGICDSCGTTRTRDNALELNAHSGEAFKRWRAKSILAAGGLLPDDLKPYAE